MLKSIRYFVLIFLIIIQSCPFVPARAWAQSGFSLPDAVTIVLPGSSFKPPIMKGITIYPESAPAYQALGIAYHMDGREALAAQSLAKVLELDPSNNDAKEMLMNLMTE